MLKLYNTLTRTIEVFNPIKKGLVTLYTCGPTVYGYAHIGNFRAYVSQDILRRYLEYKGYKVKQVMNLTDVDDKTIKNSREEGTSLDKYTIKFKKAFFEDLETLNIEKAEFYPEATKHIPEMLAIIKKLFDKKMAYVGEDGCVYFNIRNFKDYGKLSHLKLEELKAGARVKQDEYEKENAQDFALWKAWDENDGDVVWDSEFGRGRPGWHLECSAMSTKYLGDTFDIHAGGVDLIFPHHENEIAQTEGATGKPFAKFWIHNEHLLVNGKKMSKSLGNFYTLRDLLDQGRNPKAIRYLLMATHYRQQLNFTIDGIEAAENSVQRLLDFVNVLENIKKDNPENKEVDKLVKEAEKGFEDSMDEDLNISKALGFIFDFVKEINKLDLGKKDAQKIISTMAKFDKVLGILEQEELELTEEQKKMVEDREKAREEKDFEKADKLRDKLLSQGIVLEDTPDGIRWKKK
jgi:cysteinyl-tRNA synthetase